MNIVQLQDMLRGIPDNRLQTEMQTPSGAVPQYLVLSEIVRRDKARSSSAEMPKTTVVEDLMNQAQSAGLGALTGNVPMAPEQGMQEAPAMYANGGFISPADAMGRSGVAGYPQPPQKQPFQLSSQPQPTSGSMFTPNTNPAPAPQTNFNLNQTPTADNGVQQNANMPSFMEQDNGYANAYAQGGVVGLKDGGSTDYREEFITMMAPHAARVAERTGVDPRIIISQAALESNWGRSAPGGNYFGIKSHGKEGGKKLKTKEVGPGGEYETTDSFRQYGGVAESVDDYGNFLMANPRYKEMISSKGLDPQIEALGKSGYATDPKYASKIKSIASGKPMEKAMNLLGMLQQNAGDMFLGAPVGLAGRETAAGLGTGAGAAAIGNAKAPIAAGTQREGGLFSGIRSLFPEGEKGTSMGSGLRDMGSAMAQGQQAPEAPEAQMKSADISGLDRLRTNPDEDLAQYAALRQQYITGGYADGGSIRMSEGGSPPQEDQRGFMEWIMGVTPEEAAQKRQAEADTKAAEDAKVLYEADPERKARILGERGPLNGDARIPEEAQKIAANSAPSPYQLLAGSQERQQKMLQDYYDSLIQLEKDRMGESQGFGSFLKELGRGMLSNTSALGPSIAAGASRAIGSREDTSAAAREKMNELAMAKKKAQIEGLGALDKLRYEQAVGDGLNTREKAQYGLPALLKALEAAQDPMTGNPELAKSIQEQLAATMKELGLGYATPAPAENAEAESDTGFWSILGMS